MIDLCSSILQTYNRHVYVSIIVRGIMYDCEFYHIDLSLAITALALMALMQIEEGLPVID